MILGAGDAGQRFERLVYDTAEARVDYVGDKGDQKSLDNYNNIVTYAKHRITNALGESLNSKIEKVERLAFGYRNRDHYKTAIYFHCGGLGLYPSRENVAFQAISQ